MTTNVDVGRSNVFGRTPAATFGRNSLRFIIIDVGSGIYKPMDATAGVAVAATDAVDGLAFPAAVVDAYCTAGPSAEPHTLAQNTPLRKQTILETGLDCRCR